MQDTPARDLPQVLCLTTARRNDCHGVDQGRLDAPNRRAAWRDHTLVRDLGYYSHARFARRRRAGGHFGSRLHRPAAVGAVRDLEGQAPWPLPQRPGGRITILAERRVTGGAPRNKRGAVVPGLRLIVARGAPLPAAARRGAQAVESCLLTDRCDLTAWEVGQLYLWRWPIELFFRWLKRFVHRPRLLGDSEPAVVMTVWLAIIVQLLTRLASLALGLTRRPPTVLGLFPEVLAQLAPADLDDPAAAPRHPALLAWALHPHPPPR